MHGGLEDSHLVVLNTLHGGKTDLSAETEILRVQCDKHAAEAQYWRRKYIETDSRAETLARQVQQLGKQADDMRYALQRAREGQEREQKNLREQLAEKQRECDSYTNHIQKLQKEFERMKVVLDKLKGEREKERDERSREQSDWDRDRSQLQLLMHRQGQDFDEEKRNSQAIQQNLQASIGEELKATKLVVEWTERARQEAISEVQTVNQKLEDMEQQVTAMHHREKAHRDALADAERQVADVTAQLEDCRLQFSQAQAGKTAVEKDLDFVKTRGEEEREKRTSLESRLRQKEQECAALQDKSHQLEHGLERQRLQDGRTLEEETLRHERERHKVTERLEGAEVTIREIRNQIEWKETQLTAAQKEAKDTAAKLERSQREMEEETHRLQVKMMKLLSDHGEVSLRLQEEQDAHRAVARERDELRQQCVLASSNTTEITNRMLETEETLKRVQVADVRERAREREEYDAAYADWQRRESQLNERLHTLMRENSELNGEARNSRVVVQQLTAAQEKVTTMSDRMATNRVELQATTSENEKLRALAKKLERQLVEKGTESESLWAQIQLERQKLHDREQELKAVVDGLQEQLGSLENEKYRECERLAGELRSAKGDTTATVEHSVRQLEDQKAQFQTAIQQMQAEQVAPLRTQLETIRREKENSEHQCRILSDNSMQQEVEAQRLRMVATEKERELERLRLAIDSRDRELEEQRRQSTRMTAEVQMASTEKEEDASRWKQRFAEMESEQRRLALQLSEAGDRRKVSDDAFNSEISELNTTKFRLTKERDEVLAQLAKASQEIAQLKATHATSMSSIETLKARGVALEQQLVLRETASTQEQATHATHMRSQEEEARAMSLRLSHTETELEQERQSHLETKRLLEDRGSQLQEVNQQVQKLSNDVTSRTHEVAQTQSVLRETQGDVDQEKRLNAEREQLNLALRSAVEKERGNVAALQTELADLHGRLTEARAQSSLREQKHEEALRALEDQLQQQKHATVESQRQEQVGYNRHNAVVVEIKEAHREEMNAAKTELHQLRAFISTVLHQLKDLAECTEQGLQLLRTASVSWEEPTFKWEEGQPPTVVLQSQFSQYIAVISSLLQSATSTPPHTVLITPRTTITGGITAPAPRPPTPTGPTYHHHHHFTACDGTEHHSMYGVTHSQHSIRLDPSGGYSPPRTPDMPVERGRSGHRGNSNVVHLLGFSKR